MADIILNESTNGMNANKKTLLKMISSARDNSILDNILSAMSSNATIEEINAAIYDNNFLEPDQKKRLATFVMDNRSMTGIGRRTRRTRRKRSKRSKRTRRH